MNGFDSIHGITVDTVNWRTDICSLQCSQIEQQAMFFILPIQEKKVCSRLQGEVKGVTHNHPDKHKIPLYT